MPMSFIAGVLLAFLPMKLLNSSSRPLPPVQLSAENIGHQDECPTCPPIPRPVSYTVKPGDSLSKIAQQNYWLAIENANPGKVRTRHVLYPGEKLVLPVAIVPSGDTGKLGDK